MVTTAQLFPATFAEFLQQTERGNVVAVVRTIAAGVAEPMDPLEAFERVAGSARYAFLFESVEGSEPVAKYSFLGADPYLIARGRGDETIFETGELVVARPKRVTEYLRDHFQENKLANAADLGPLAGGVVGYFGYAAAEWFEPALKRNAAAQSDARSEAANVRSEISDSRSQITEDDAVLMFYRTVVVFDRVQRQTKVVSVVLTNEAGHSDVRLQELYETAARETERIEKLLLAPSPSLANNDRASTDAPTENASSTNAHEPAKASVRSNWARADFESAVNAVKEYIFAGDCYQGVISQRFARSVTASPVAIYRALRRTNPAPYTYLLKLADEAIIGASPEMLVRCRGARLDYRPIAGTRPRGATEAEDNRLAEEMRADEKEVAEHMMLVDLGRNDLGRVAEFGSVKVEDLMSVERYSKVQHLVSSLSGRLRAGADRFDALAACFPAGTVTGAPKVRAMEIIRELEPDERGVYAGAVLYIDYAENLDSCIAIRTIVMRDGEVSVQAGAGIVADSVPEREYEETVHKAGALLRAIELAEGEED